MTDIQNRIVTDTCCIIIYQNGHQTKLRNGEKAFDTVMQSWKKMTETAIEMPAFGVSIHDLTMQAREQGLWIEFVFDKQHEHNGMPYEQLLVHCENDSYGFNLERFYNRAYGGRCFYLSLQKNTMSDFCTELLRHI